MSNSAVKRRPPKLDSFRSILIRRPQYPHIIKWVDAEFQVIYINLDAAPDAKIVGLL